MMKHIAKIQVEFLKQARDWDELSYEEQMGYLSRHPKTKRKITAKPDGSQPDRKEVTEPKEVNEQKETPQNESKIVTNIGKINKSKEADIVDFFKPLFTEHEEYLKTHITKQFDEQRNKFLTQFPKKPENLKKAVWLLENPGNQQISDIVNDKINANTFEGQRLIRDVSKQFPIKDEEGYLEFYSQFGPTIYDKNQFDDRVNKIIEISIEANESKLVRAIYSKLEGLDIKSVEEIYSHIGKQGIEGTYKIELNDGTTGKMSTRSIFAGGYNIQVLHYRYLINIDDSLQNKKEIEEEPLTPQEFEVKNIIKKMLPENFDISTPIPIEIMRKVDDLPGASRNFSPFIKKGLMFRREYGNYAIKRYHYYITQEGLNFFKSNQGETEELKQQDTNIRDSRQKEKLAKNIGSIFQEIKSRVKDWDGWEKENLKYYIAKGERPQSELDEKEKKINRLRDFLAKYNFKRSELQEKVLNNEITLSIFDEIDDLLSGNRNYKDLKK